MITPDLAAECLAGSDGPPVSVDTARNRAKAAAPSPTQTELLTLDQALGRVLAAMEAAPHDLPPFDNSAMDGYALDCSSLDATLPCRLPVSTRIVAGDTARHALGKGEAARILTGAPIPAGANAVIMQEQVIVDGDHVIVRQRPRIGQNIRRRGEDNPAGTSIINRGQLLTAPRLALLAATGVDAVSVYRPLRVGLFSTGNELREPGEPLSFGQIYNSNRVLLRAMLTKPWITIADYGIVRDDPASIRSVIRRAASRNDVVISSGGVSAGEEDHVLDALRKEDATLEVLKVAIRPGKPLTVGRIGSALYFGLPGNPYAVAITFGQIALPAIRKSAGITEAPENTLIGISDFSYSRTSGRTEYVPVSWERRDAFGRPFLSRLGQGASASLSPIALAKGVAAIPAELREIAPGQPLNVQLLD